MDIIVVILIIIAIFFLSFYSGIEVAFSRANRLGIELSKKQGSPAGVLISRLLDEPVRFIGTVITGYNFFLVVFVLLVSTFWHHLLDKSDIIKSFLLPTRLILEIKIGRAHV